MAFKTIILKGAGVRKEAQAGGIVTPGHLVKRATDGDIEVHDTAAGNAMPAFAIENELAGKEITDAYAVDDRIFWEVLPAGAEVFALVAAAAPAIIIGDFLESAGDGTLRKLAADVAGVRATITFGLTDAGVIFTANAIGDEGNDITIEYLAATAATQTVVVTGNAIVIKPDNTTPGTTDQAADIITLINADAEASALIVATALGSGASAVVTPVAETNLAGGLDTAGPVYPVAMAIEAIDNSGGGAAVRIQAEVL